MAKLSDKAKAIIEVLRAAGDNAKTAQDLKDEMDTSIQSITGTFNSLVKKGLGVREEAVVEVDGEEKTVKFLNLTAEGKTVDLDADSDAE